MPDNPVAVPMYLQYGALGLLAVVLVGLWFALKGGLRVMEKVGDRIACAFDAHTAELKKLVEHEQARETGAERRHADTRVFVLQEVGKINNGLQAEMSTTRHQLAGMIQRGHAIVLNALYAAGVVKEPPGAIPIRTGDET